MIVVYGLTGLFIGWLAVMLYRVWRMVFGCRANFAAWPNLLAVLVQDQAGGVEGLVHRLVMGLRSCPEMSIALLDGGSADETGLILKRLARRYNMEFYQLAGGVSGTDCWPVRCLDLRGIAVQDLIKFDLSKIT